MLHVEFQKVARGKNRYAPAQGRREMIFISCGETRHAGGNGHFQERLVVNIWQ
jgi:hypothetical protein